MGMERSYRCRCSGGGIVVGDDLHRRLVLALMITIVVFLTSSTTNTYYQCNAGTTDHRYAKGEHVELWVNKVRSCVLMFLIFYCHLNDNLSFDHVGS
jgi:hypothetical protein